MTFFPLPPIWGYGREAAARYALNAIKAAFADIALLNRTMTAAAGAEDLGMDEQGIVDVISGLMRQDFDKSMRSEANPATWQDVYKPVVGGRELYVKFTWTHRANCCLSVSKRMSHDQPT